MDAVPQIVSLLIAVNGRSPFEEWMTGLSDRVARARIDRRLDSVERGTFGDHRPLGSGVSELRLDFGPGYRVYYGRIGNTMLVLIGGGTKRDQRARIAEAIRLWHAYRAAGSPESLRRTRRGDTQVEEARSAYPVIPVLPASGADEAIECEHGTMGLKPFQEFLMRELRDPGIAAAYLQDAWEDSMDEFLIALRKYVRANGGMDGYSEDTGIPGATGSGEPDLGEWAIDSLMRLHGIRLKISVQPKRRQSRRALEEAAAG
jgi:putative addiction module killer protein